MSSPPARLTPPTAASSPPGRTSPAPPSAAAAPDDRRQRGQLEAFNIGGNNYFMLRALGEALGFEVDYDAATRTMIVNSK